MNLNFWICGNFERIKEVRRMNNSTKQNKWWIYLIFFSIGIVSFIISVVLGNFFSLPLLIYTIFEFHSIGEGFGFSLYPLSMFAISVIVGLFFAITKTPQNNKREMKYL
ncbi:MAG: hypothetical protein C5S44_01510 [Candidatus Methanocomedens sp.]|nr:MAG: hypothetical protein C5S44_01510 [ANME-2 cluster archaeon]